MPIYLGYESAIEMLCYLRTRVDDTAEWCVSCSKTITQDAVHGKLELAAMDEEARELLSHLTKPYHVLVRRPDQMRATKTIKPHLWNGDVGRRAFIDLGHDVYLSMPAFAFLQMATELTHVELIMLGMMLCGYYSPGPMFGRSKLNANLDAPLTKLHKNMVCSAQAFELQPLCSEYALQRFIDNRKHVKGIKAARAAAPWVRENAASHMETALYLLLCLPVRMGGYGIPTPVLNPEVHVRQASGKITCFPDLYWRAPSIDVEYQSDWAHATISANYRDSRRMVAVVCNDIDYLAISTGQLKRADDMDNAARGLASKLGHRIRITCEDWASRRAKLRATVLPAGFEEFDGESFDFESPYTP